MADAPVRNGVEYDLVLVTSDDTGRAVYDVVVKTRGAETPVRVTIAEGVATVDEDSALPAALRDQLLAVARTVARHVESAEWPRRVRRWRPA